MADNQFSVRVPNALEALMGGEQGYKDVVGAIKEQKLATTREQAAQSIMQGGDPKNALAQLLGIGDDKGAATLATVIHNKQQGEFQQQQLQQQGSQFQTSSAESARHDRATEGQAAATLAEQRRQHDLDLGKPLVAGEDPYTGGKSYVVRDKTGNYVPLVLPQQPQPSGASPPAAPSAAASPVASPFPNAPTAGNPQIVNPAQPIPLPQPGQASPGAAPPTSPPQAAVAPPTDPEERRRADFLASRPPQVANIIKGIANYDLDARTMLARLPAGARTRIMSDVAEYRPDYNQQNYPASQAAYTKFTSGKESATVRSFSVGLEHLDQLGELGAALKNGDYPLLNSLRNKAKTFIGDADPTNFNGLKAIVGAEIVKAIVGAGGTGEERAAAAKTVNDASSPVQLNGIIDTYKKAMGAQLGGLKQTYETGTMRNDFSRYLSPGAIKAFEAHQRASAKSEGGTSAGNIPAPPAGFHLVQ